MRRALLALAGVATLARPAHALCMLDGVSGVAFGTYDTFSLAPLDSAGTITYKCLVSLSITIDLSTGASGTYASRTLTKTGGTDTLSYNLYTDPARLQVWGNGGNGTAHYGPLLGLLVDVVIPIYGRIPARQDVATGSYADTLVVTLNF